jgi:hypothetical protein
MFIGLVVLKDLNVDVFQKRAAEHIASHFRTIAALSPRAPFTLKQVRVALVDRSLDDGRKARVALIILAGNWFHDFMAVHRFVVSHFFTCFI